MLFIEFTFFIFVALTVNFHDNSFFLFFFFERDKIYKCLKRETQQNIIARSVKGEYQNLTKHITSKNIIQNPKKIVLLRQLQLN
jgi:hypothetical protein